MKTSGFAAALNVKSNGLYRAPEQVALLQATVRRAGLRWIVVDLRRARGKHALLSACARGSCFPPALAATGMRWPIACRICRGWRSQAR